MAIGVTSLNFKARVYASAAAVALVVVRPNPEREWPLTS